MLIFDACSEGELTAFVLRVRGTPAQQHVTALFGETNLPVPIHEGDETQRYEDFGDHDLANVPVIDLLVTMHSERDALVEARYDACTMRLALPPPRSQLRGARPATAHECVELGLRWCMGLGRLGCFDPLEAVFWGERVEAEAWCVEEPVVSNRLVPTPKKYVVTMQAWLSRIPQEKHFEAVNRVFGAESGDAFCVMRDCGEEGGDIQPRHQVLVAALTTIEGIPPSRVATRSQSMADD